MNRPYCHINGKVYQLGIVNGVLRFPNDGRDMPNLNLWALEYFNGQRPLSDLFEYYINSGCSYELVHGYFSTNGINNHMVTQGKEKVMSFRLYS